MHTMLPSSGHGAKLALRVRPARGGMATRDFAHARARSRARIAPRTRAIRTSAHGGRGGIGIGRHGGTFTGTHACMHDRIDGRACI